MPRLHRTALTAFISFLLTFLPLSVFAQDREKVFDAESMVLDNGMQVVVVENHRVPVVTHMVWYRAGAADQQHGKSGVAHFLEHLMFKGSKQVGGPDLAPGEFSKIVRSLGGDDNAFTSQDYTAYFQSIPAEHLEEIMKIEAGRMRGMQPPMDEVESERLVVLEERRQRTENDPEARFDEALTAPLFVNHPYEKPIIGWMHELKELSFADTKNFYDRYYAPNNAILIVSGAIQAQQVFDLARQVYGQIRPRHVPDRARTKTPPLGGKTHIEFSDPAVRQPVFKRIYRVPSYRQSVQDSLALQVLEEILSGGSASRLYQSLVVNQKLTSSISMFYQADAWNNGRIWLYATPRPSVTFQQLENAIDKELQKVIDTPVSKTELKEAVQRLQDKAVYARDSLTGPAMIIGRSLITGTSLDDIEYWPDNIAKVTAAQIQDVARRYISPNSKETRFVTGYLEGKNTNEK